MCGLFFFLACLLAIPPIRLRLFYVLAVLIHAYLLRFVGIPAPALQAKLGSQVKEIETEVDALGKRLHYLETTAKNSQEHIEKMLKGAGQA